MEKQRSFNYFLKITNPAILFFCLACYTIGTGVYFYLGRTVNIEIYSLGSAIILLNLVFAHYLNEYFNELKFNEHGKNDKEFFKKFYLIMGLSSLAVEMYFSNWLLSKTDNNVIILVFIFSFVLLGLVFAAPPFSFQRKGYSIIIYEIILVILSPAFGYFLQSEEIHPIVLWLTFPSIFLGFASFIALSLESYLSDMKDDHRTILTNLGWQKGINFHNLSILLCYSTFTLATILGMPWKLSIVVFFSLPFALVQLWEMSRIRDGFKPRWKLLKFSAIGSVSSLVYFISFYLWLG